MSDSNTITSRLLYPNPFHPTGVEFELQVDAVVTVKILDAGGKDVEVLIQRQEFPPGKHVVPFDTRKYGSGQFWYNVSAEAEGKTLTETREIR